VIPARAFLETARAMRARRFAVVFNQHGGPRSVVLTRASGAPVRVGFDRPRAETWRTSPHARPAEAYRHAWKGAREGSWIAYTHRIRIPTIDIHAVDRYLLVGPLLGLDDRPPDFSFVIPRPADLRVDELLHTHGIGDTSFAVLAPGTMWETKHWAAENFAAVARHFLRQGRRVVLVGTDRDRRTCAEVALAAPGAVDLAGRTTLSELAALVRRAAICLTNDSGAMHLAVALGRPVVSVFGPSDPLWIGPYRRPESVVAAGVPCAPCYLRELRRCRYGHACMRDVSPETVIERAEGILASPTRTAAAG